MEEAHSPPKGGPSTEDPLVFQDGGFGVFSALLIAGGAFLVGRFVYNLLNPYCLGCTWQDVLFEESLPLIGSALLLYVGVYVGSRHVLSLDQASRQVVAQSAFLWFIWKDIEIPFSDVKRIERTEGGEDDSNSSQLVAEGGMLGQRWLEECVDGNE
ncbi:MAG: hypothetical protein ACPGK0_03530, partial [Candidatus Poseidoniaceae archaeon]